MQHDKALLNISRKLQIYLSEHQLSILKLSKKIPTIKYQTLKRMVEFDRDTSTPNLYSLDALSAFFNCTVAELIDENIILTIESFPSLKNFLSNHDASQAKIYIPIEEYVLNKSNKLFAIQIAEQNIEKGKNKNIIPYLDPAQKLQIFMRIDKLEYDGYYIVEYKKQVSIINIVSVSRNFLMVEEENGQILKLNVADIKIIAIFIKNGILIKDPKNLLLMYYS